MGKFEELKKAIANPPPQRLAKIEYQSHFLQILGITFVCAILIYKGLWYIIFAFIFGVGISYSQGTGAYQKYKAIMAIVGDDYDFAKDKSPSRKRDYVIRKEFGKTAWWTSMIASVVLTYTLVNEFGFTSWYERLSLPFFAILIFVILYYYIYYWLSVSISEKVNERREIE